MSSPPRILRVAVIAPLRGYFDYLAPDHLTPPPQIGCRVRVPFGRGERLGLIVEMSNSTAWPLTKLKPVSEVLDAAPILDHTQIELGRWTADYYFAAPGEVFEAALPPRGRRAAVLNPTTARQWVLTVSGRDALDSARRLGPRQRSILHAARKSLISAELRALGINPTSVKALMARGWLKESEPVAAPRTSVIYGTEFPLLNPAQAEAFAQINATALGYSASLLHGVTGSGKTEIYLHLVRDVLEAAGQALILIPEIGLTEQLVARFVERFGDTVAVMHSDVTDARRYQVWEGCRSNQVGVLLGTRSAVWAPLPALRLIIVDEEHDASFRQQEGIRYSARDVAVWRAFRANIPIVLGSATPSLESMANGVRGKYRYLKLTTRATGAALPSISVVDVRNTPLNSGVSAPLDQALRACFARQEQALLFLNRRGYAPAVVCHHCGWLASCPRCDARLVLHHEQQRLRCHHCASEFKHGAKIPNHACGAFDTFATLGVGTEQLEQYLRNLYPTARIVRIDRDSMSRKGQFESTMRQVAAREFDLLIGTQMIAKGHDFTHVSLVGIIDGDGGLLASDFRATERFAQQVLQVAGRAGRAQTKGAVMIQTHHPFHPIFEFLRATDYSGFANYALAERAAAELPPYSALALVRAEAASREKPLSFLTSLVNATRANLPRTLTIGGPIPALMERKVGKYRANLLLTTPDRTTLAACLDVLVNQAATLPEARAVRWYVDVDALDVA